jgi:L-threonylcarbamoyladenylate synthase
MGCLAVTVDPATLDRAARAIGNGELVVYPTETVYGLGADALDSTAVERVFDVKRRERSKPISLAVPSIEAAESFVELSTRERRFMEAMLPGPVTVVCAKTDRVPEVLTAGRSRVGVRIPDHPVALELLERVAPVTATSANVSGRGSVRHPDALPEAIRDAVAAVIDDGETPGGGSTVVDVERGDIHRRGHMVETVEAWLRKQ